MSVEEEKESFFEKELRIIIHVDATLFWAMKWKSPFHIGHIGLLIPLYYSTRFLYSTCHMMAPGDVLAQKWSPST